LGQSRCSRRRWPLLPPTVAQEQGIAPLPAADKGPAALRILLAEDNPVNQIVARRMIEKEGHHVTVAADGRAAANAWTESGTGTPFDVIFMDIQMPELDGFEVTALIRAEERLTGRHVPIVAVTAHAMEGYRERCLSAGMDGYLTKPIVPRELHDVLVGISAEKLAAIPAT
jgi:two-component system, sensor histidine kinase and response regulator